MRGLAFGFGLLLCCLLPLSAGAEAPDNGGISTVTFSVLKYFPGDVVHLVVDVPPDVVSVTATMPDGEQLNLGFSLRSRVWHNYWEVPAGFKKGGYTAKLRAVDVAGRVFEGESDLFYIGEPSLPMIMKLATTKEVRTYQPEVAERKVERKPSAQKPQLAKSKPKPAKKARVRRPVASPSRMRLMVEAREQLFRQDYGKLQNRLDALLKIDPGNNEIRTMRNKAAKGIKIK